MIDENFPKVDATLNARMKLIWITCGTADSLIGVNRAFKDWLTSKNVKFEQQEVPEVGHVWPLWRRNLTEFVPKLFQALSDPASRQSRWGHCNDTI